MIWTGMRLFGFIGHRKKFSTISEQSSFGFCTSWTFGRWPAWTCESGGGGRKEYYEIILEHPEQIPAKKDDAGLQSELVEAYEQL